MSLFEIISGVRFAVVAAMYKRGAKATDAERFGEVVATIHAALSHPVNSDRVSLTVAIGPVPREAFSGVYIQLRSCCGACTVSIDGLTPEEIGHAIDRAKSNAIEMATDIHTKDGVCPAPARQGNNA